MIYLTGDVHGKIAGHWEQKNAGSEIDAAVRYLEILKKYKIVCTLFINGKCLDENKKEVRELMEYDVELGGHTYDNFGRMNIFKSYINRKFFGCVYGGFDFQERDIMKTKIAFDKFGLKMKCWRTHAFASNNDTFRILAKNEVKYVSDLIGDRKPFEKNGIIHIPINIPVDNLVMEFGILKPENRDPFASCTKGRIKAEEWFDIIKKRVVENEKNGNDSILLIHPISMKVLDNFKLFEKIAKFLSKYESSKVIEFEVGIN